MKQIHWKSFEKATELDAIHEASFDTPQLIFKHSTRCSISSIAMNRLESQAADLDHTPRIHLLDLIQYRELSRNISEKYSVRHESPQLLVIYQGKCIHHDSHLDISLDRISVSQLKDEKENQQ